MKSILRSLKDKTTNFLEKALSRFVVIFLLFTMLFNLAIPFSTVFGSVQHRKKMYKQKHSNFIIKNQRNKVRPLPPSLADINIRQDIFEWNKKAVGYFFRGDQKIFSGQDDLVGDKIYSLRGFVEMILYYEKKKYKISFLENIDKMSLKSGGETFIYTDVYPQIEKFVVQIMNDLRVNKKIDFIEESLKDLLAGVSKQDYEASVRALSRSFISRLSNILLQKANNVLPIKEDYSDAKKYEIKILRQTFVYMRDVYRNNTDLLSVEEEKREYFDEGIIFLFDRERHYKGIYGGAELEKRDKFYYKVGESDPFSGQIQEMKGKQILGETLLSKGRILQKRIYKENGRYTMEIFFDKGGDIKLEVLKIDKKEVFRRFYNQGNLKEEDYNEEMMFLLNSMSRKYLKEDLIKESELIGNKYSNGRIRKETSYTMHKKKLTTYYDDSEDHFIDAKIECLEDGKISWIEVYEKYGGHVLVIYFDEDENISKKVLKNKGIVIWDREYKMNVPNGLEHYFPIQNEQFDLKIWWMNGRKAWKAKYFGTKIDGLVEYFNYGNKDDQVEKRVMMSDGKQIWTKIYQDGKLTLEERFNNDEQVNQQIYWNNGKIISINMLQSSYKLLDDLKVKSSSQKYAGLGTGSFSNNVIGGIMLNQLLNVKAPQSIWRLKFDTENSEEEMDLILGKSSDNIKGYLSDVIKKDGFVTLTQKQLFQIGEIILFNLLTKTDKEQIFNKEDVLIINKRNLMLMNTSFSEKSLEAKEQLRDTIKMFVSQYLKGEEKDAVRDLIKDMNLLSQIKMDGGDRDSDILEHVSEGIMLGIKSIISYKEELQSFYTEVFYEEITELNEVLEIVRSIDIGAIYPEFKIARLKANWMELQRIPNEVLVDIGSDVKTYLNRKTFNWEGKYVKYLPNTKIISEQGEYKNGKKEGEFYSYDMNTNEKITIFYVKDKRHGPCQLDEIKGWYRDDAKYGVWIEKNKKEWYYLGGEIIVDISMEGKDIKDVKLYGNVLNKEVKETEYQRWAGKNGDVEIRSVENGGRIITVKILEREEKVVYTLDKNGSLIKEIEAISPIRDKYKSVFENLIELIEAGRINPFVDINANLKKGVIVNKLKSSKKRYKIGIFPIEKYLGHTDVLTMLSTMVKHSLDKVLLIVNEKKNWEEYKRVQERLKLDLRSFGKLFEVLDISEEVWNDKASIEDWFLEATKDFVDGKVYSLKKMKEDLETLQKKEEKINEVEEVEILRKNEKEILESLWKVKNLLEETNKNVLRIGIEDDKNVPLEIGVNIENVNFVEEIRNIEEGYSSILTNLSQLAVKGDIRPDVNIDIVNEKEKAIITKKENKIGRSLRVGFLEMGGDLVHHGYILVALKMMVKYELDKLVWVIPGVDEGNLDDSIQYETRYKMLKASLEPFGNLFEVTDIGRDTPYSAETNVCRFLEQNEGTEMDVYYFVGKDLLGHKDKKVQKDREEAFHRLLSEGIEIPDVEQGWKRSEKHNNKEEIFTVKTAKKMKIYHIKKKHTLELQKKEEEATSSDPLSKDQMLREELFYDMTVAMGFNKVKILKSVDKVKEEIKDAKELTVNELQDSNNARTFGKILAISFMTGNMDDIFNLEKYLIKNGEIYLMGGIMRPLEFIKTLKIQNNFKDKEIDILQQQENSNESYQYILLKAFVEYIHSKGDYLLDILQAETNSEKQSSVLPPNVNIKEINKGFINGLISIGNNYRYTGTFDKYSENIRKDGIFLKHSIDTLKDLIEAFPNIIEVVNLDKLDKKFLLPRISGIEHLLKNDIENYLIMVISNKNQVYRETDILSAKFELAQYYILGGKNWDKALKLLKSIEDLNYVNVFYWMSIVYERGNEDLGMAISYLKGVENILLGNYSRVVEKQVITDGYESMKFDEPNKRTSINSGGITIAFDGSIEVLEYKDDVTGHWIKVIKKTINDTGENIVSYSALGVLSKEFFAAWIINAFIPDNVHKPIAYRKVTNENGDKQHEVYFEFIETSDKSTRKDLYSENFNLDPSFTLTEDNFVQLGKILFLHIILGNVDGLLEFNGTNILLGKDGYLKTIDVTFTAWQVYIILIQNIVKRQIGWFVEKDSSINTIGGLMTKKNEIIKKVIKIVRKAREDFKKKKHSDFIEMMISKGLILILDGFYKKGADKKEVNRLILKGFVEVMDDIGEKYNDDIFHKMDAIFDNNTKLEVGMIQSIFQAIAKEVGSENRKVEKQVITDGYESMKFDESNKRKIKRTPIYEGNKSSVAVLEYKGVTGDWIKVIKKTANDTGENIVSYSALGVLSKEFFAAWIINAFIPNNVHKPIAYRKVTNGNGDKQHEAYFEFIETSDKSTRKDLYEQNFHFDSSFTLTEDNFVQLGKILFLHIILGNVDGLLVFNGKNILLGKDGHLKTIDVTFTAWQVYMTLIHDFVSLNIDWSVETDSSINTIGRLMTKKNEIIKKVIEIVREAREDFEKKKYSDFIEMMTSGGRVRILDILLTLDRLYKKGTDKKEVNRLILKGFVEIMDDIGKKYNDDIFHKMDAIFDNNTKLEVGMIQSIFQAIAKEVGSENREKVKETGVEETDKIRLPLLNRLDEALEENKTISERIKHALTKAYGEVEMGGKLLHYLPLGALKIIVKKELYGSGGDGGIANYLWERLGYNDDSLLTEEKDLEKPEILSDSDEEFINDPNTKITEMKNLGNVGSRDTGVLVLMVTLENSGKQRKFIFKVYMSEPFDLNMKEGIDGKQGSFGTMMGEILVLKELERLAKSEKRPISFEGEKMINLSKDAMLRMHEDIQEYYKSHIYRRNNVNTFFPDRTEDDAVLMVVREIFEGKPLADLEFGMINLDAEEYKSYTYNYDDSEVKNDDLEGRDDDLEVENDDSEGRDSVSSSNTSSSTDSDMLASTSYSYSYYDNLQWEKNSDTLSLMLGESFAVETILGIPDHVQVGKLDNYFVSGEGELQMINNSISVTCLYVGMSDMLKHEERFKNIKEEVREVVYDKFEKFELFEEKKNMKELLKKEKEWFEAFIDMYQQDPKSFVEKLIGYGEDLYKFRGMLYRTFLVKGKTEEEAKKIVRKRMALIVEGFAVGLNILAINKEGAFDVSALGENQDGSTDVMVEILKSRYEILSQKLNPKITDEAQSKKERSVIYENKGKEFQYFSNNVLIDVGKTINYWERNDEQLKYSLESNKDEGNDVENEAVGFILTGGEGCIKMSLDKFGYLWQKSQREEDIDNALTKEYKEKLERREDVKAPVFELVDFDENNGGELYIRIEDGEDGKNKMQAMYRLGVEKYIYVQRPTEEMLSMIQEGTDIDALFPELNFSGAKERRINIVLGANNMVDHEYDRLFKTGIEIEGERVRCNLFFDNGVGISFSKHGYLEFLMITILESEGYIKMVSHYAYDLTDYYINNVKKSEDMDVDKYTDKLRDKMFNALNEFQEKKNKGETQLFIGDFNSVERWRELRDHIKSFNGRVDNIIFDGNVIYFWRPYDEDGFEIISIIYEILSTGGKFIFPKNSMRHDLQTIPFNLRSGKVIFDKYAKTVKLFEEYVEKGRIKIIEIGEEKEYALTKEGKQYIMDKIEDRKSVSLDIAILQSIYRKNDGTISPATLKNGDEDVVYELLLAIVKKNVPHGWGSVEEYAGEYDKRHKEKGYVMFEKERQIDSPVMDELKKFIDMQKTTYEQAFKEMKAGKKNSHGIWYIFPKLKNTNPIGILSSENAQNYAIGNVDEAQAYLKNKVLGTRLNQITYVVVDILNSGKNIHSIFSDDDVKFVASMTLFFTAYVMNHPTLKRDSLIESDYFKALKLSNLPICRFTIKELGFSEKIKTADNLLDFLMSKRESKILYAVGGIEYTNNPEDLFRTEFKQSKFVKGGEKTVGTLEHGINKSHKLLEYSPEEPSSPRWGKDGRYAPEPKFHLVRAIEIKNPILLREVRALKLIQTPQDGDGKKEDKKEDKKDSSSDKAGSGANDKDAENSEDNSQGATGETGSIGSGGGDKRDDDDNGDDKKDKKKEGIDSLTPTQKENKDQSKDPFKKFNFDFSNITYISDIHAATQCSLILTDGRGLKVLLKHNLRKDVTEGNINPRGTVTANTIMRFVSGDNYVPEQEIISPKDIVSLKQFLDVYYDNLHKDHFQDAQHLKFFIEDMLKNHVGEFYELQSEGFGISLSEFFFHGKYRSIATINTISRIGFGIGYMFMYDLLFQNFDRIVQPNMGNALIGTDFTVIPIDNDIRYDEVSYKLWGIDDLKLNEDKVHFYKEFHDYVYGLIIEEKSLSNDNIKIVYQHLLNFLNQLSYPKLGSLGYFMKKWLIDEIHKGIIKATYDIVTAFQGSGYKSFKLLMESSDYLHKEGLEMVEKYSGIMKDFKYDEKFDPKTYKIPTDMSSPALSLKGQVSQILVQKNEGSTGVVLERKDKFYSYFFIYGPYMTDFNNGIYYGVIVNNGDGTFNLRFLNENGRILNDRDIQIESKNGQDAVSILSQALFSDTSLKKYKGIELLTYNQSDILKQAEISTEIRDKIKFESIVIKVTNFRKAVTDIHDVATVIADIIGQTSPSYKDTKQKPLDSFSVSNPPEESVKKDYLDEEIVSTTTESLNGEGELINSYEKKNTNGGSRERLSDAEVDREKQAVVMRRLKLRDDVLSIGNDVVISANIPSEIDHPALKLIISRRDRIHPESISISISKNSNTSAFWNKLRDKLKEINCTVDRMIFSKSHTENLFYLFSDYDVMKIWHNILSPDGEVLLPKVSMNIEYKDLSEAEKYDQGIFDQLVRKYEYTIWNKLIDLIHIAVPKGWNYNSGYVEKDRDGENGEYYRFKKEMITKDQIFITNTIALKSDKVALITLDDGRQVVRKTRLQQDSKSEKAIYKRDTGALYLEYIGNRLMDLILTESRALRTTYYNNKYDSEEVMYMESVSQKYVKTKEDVASAILTIKNQVLTNQQWIQFGEILFLDFILGNSDRLIFFNPDNLLIDKNGRLMVINTIVSRIFFDVEFSDRSLDSTEWRDSADETKLLTKIKSFLNIWDIFKEDENNMHPLIKRVLENKDKKMVNFMKLQDTISKENIYKYVSIGMLQAVANVVNNYSEEKVLEFRDQMREFHMQLSNDVKFICSIFDMIQKEFIGKIGEIQQLIEKEREITSSIRNQYKRVFENLIVLVKKENINLSVDINADLKKVVTVEKQIFSRKYPKIGIFPIEKHLEHKDILKALNNMAKDQLDKVLWIVDKGNDWEEYKNIQNISMSVLNSFGVLFDVLDISEDVWSGTESNLDWFLKNSNEEYHSKVYSLDNEVGPRTEKKSLYTKRKEVLKKPTSPTSDKQYIPYYATHGDNFVSGQHKDVKPDGMWYFYNQMGWIVLQIRYEDGVITEWLEYENGIKRKNILILSIVTDLISGVLDNTIKNLEAQMDALVQQ